MELKTVGEFGLIDRIRSSFPSPGGVQGIGDDCAIIPQSEGMETLVSTDMLVEGTHFILDEVTPYCLGWKSAAVNFSDIAAMGGEPVGSFLAFALPKSLPDGWVDEFLRGYGDISHNFGFPLLGGDTTSAPEGLSICVTVLGKARKGCSMKRSTAMAGDLVCVTGRLGDSAGGLDVVLNSRERNSDAEYLLSRHYLPSPRMKEGRKLAMTPGVHAMMDISDGIASDLRHIMDESHLGALIEVDALPLSEQLSAHCKRYSLDAVRLAACGGEDYELLFTVDPLCVGNVELEYAVIGRMTEHVGCLEWKGIDNTASDSFRGFSHF